MVASVQPATRKHLWAMLTGADGLNVLAGPRACSRAGGSGLPEPAHQDTQNRDLLV